MSAILFFLGTHETSWLAKLDVPLFVSHRRLAIRKRLPVARASWALDSGGFTELNKPPHRWVTTVGEYVEAVARYGEEIGRLEWAAPMDWMCEPLPVLQGWTLDDYEVCLELYADAGVDLAAEPVVGVGSVCRRQSTPEIGRIMRTLHGAGVSCHGFGVKKEGLRRYGRFLVSADSMAWSYTARRDWPLPGCTHGSCANCSRYALRWRDELLAADDQLELEMAA